MNVKQKIAIITPPILVAFMYPIFHLLAGVMNDRIAWYLWIFLLKRIELTDLYFFYIIVCDNSLRRGS